MDRLDPTFSALEHLTFPELYEKYDDKVAAINLPQQANHPETIAEEDGEE